MRNFLITCLVGLFAISLLGAVNSDEGFKILSSIQDDVFQDFVTNNVIGSSDATDELNYFEADWLYDANFFKCATSSSGTAYAPVPTYGPPPFYPIIGWSCGSGKDYYPTNDVTINVGVLGLDEICGTDYSLPGDRGSSTITIEDLFPADWTTQFAFPYTYKKVRSITLPEYGGNEGTKLNANFKSILAKGGGIFFEMPTACVY